MTTKRIIMLVVLGGVVALLACKKNTDTSHSQSSAGQISATLNSDDILNKSFTINGTIGVSRNGGMYVTGNKYTIVKLSDGSGSVDNTVNSFFLSFDGSKKGLQQLGTPLITGDDNF